MDPDDSRRELLRRYLLCYGPSTATDFSEWAGISPACARGMWSLIEADLVAEDLGVRTAWLNRDNLAAYYSPPEAAGARLLLPHDPYLLQRDRETLVQDSRLHSRIWKSAGNPGGVLAHGVMVGIWRQQEKGRRLSVLVEPSAPLSKATRPEIEAEASVLAAFKACDLTETVYVA